MLDELLVSFFDSIGGYNGCLHEKMPLTALLPLLEAAIMAES